MTEKIATVRAAFLLSLALHAGFGWWALRADLLQRQSAAAPPVADQRMMVQLLTLPPPKIQNPLQSEAQAPMKPAYRQQLRQVALSPRLESSEGQPAPARPPADAQASLGVVQTPTPIAAAQPAAVLNLDTRRAVTSTELQRRKSPVAAAVDASQSENSQTLQARAFAKLAPAGSSIVSETIMADGSRLIRFSAGGCMRVVNPSSRNHDDIRRSAMENC